MKRVKVRPLVSHYFTIHGLTSSLISPLSSSYMYMIRPVQKIKKKKNLLGRDGHVIPCGSSGGSTDQEVRLRDNG